MVRSSHHQRFIQETLAQPQELFQQDEILAKFNLKIHKEFIKDFISYIRGQQIFINQEIINTAIYLAHILYYHNPLESAKYSYEDTKIPILVAAIKMTSNWLPINANDEMVKEIYTSIPPVNGYKERILRITYEINDFCKSFLFIPPIFHIRCVNKENKISFDYHLSVQCSYTWLQNPILALSISSTSLARLAISKTIVLCLDLIQETNPVCITITLASLEKMKEVAEKNEAKDDFHEIGPAIIEPAENMAKVFHGIDDTITEENCYHDDYDETVNNYNHDTDDQYGNNEHEQPENYNLHHKETPYPLLVQVYQEDTCKNDDVGEEGNITHDIMNNDDDNPEKYDDHEIDAPNDDYNVAEEPPENHNLHYSETQYQDEDDIIHKDHDNGEAGNDRQDVIYNNYDDPEFNGNCEIDAQNDDYNVVEDHDDRNEPPEDHDAHYAVAQYPEEDDIVNGGYDNSEEGNETHNVISHNIDEENDIEDKDIDDRSDINYINEIYDNHEQDFEYNDPLYTVIQEQEGPYNDNDQEGRLEGADDDNNPDEVEINGKMYKDLHEYINQERNELLGDNTHFEDEAHEMNNDDDEEEWEDAEDHPDNS